MEQSMGRWIDYTLPEKKSDLGRPVIPIAIGPHIFQEAIRDFGASVNITPKVIYDQINGDTLLYTNMCLQLADQSLCYPQESSWRRYYSSGTIISSHRLCGFGNRWRCKGTHYLGPTFPKHCKSHHLRGQWKICFTIKDRKKKFTFKNHIHHSPSHPQMAYLPEETTVTEKRNNQRRKNKARQPQEESVKMINTLRSEYDHLLASSFLTKKEDPGVPMIECTIGKEFSSTPSATSERMSI